VAAARVLQAVHPVRADLAVVALVPVETVLLARLTRVAAAALAVDLVVWVSEATVALAL
jgi:hypothetical protein